MYIFQRPRTGPPPALNKSLDKGKQPQFKYYTQQSEDGYRTPTKDMIKEQTQNKNPSQDSHSIDKSRTEGSKMAGRIKKPSDEDPGDDPGSEGSDAGRDAVRSSLEHEPDR